ncbi:SDR family NAD(P)-dependent oxidoreductase [Sediminitomix flava]|uniref:NAD(P)-dependent dehydrogenase (Short-subunit alcohol dehydrogenase family) n=1 Tax=Sediminitomix flava TaxID=379075 RepID=A0A315ZIY5_SEDFL|nr:SDR family NAD(P)-dependent oxidoreductase [Sediminitomix flava]PWJ45050.1 NAD(P)-dependent dehydrogenase (short-subunit alcohol dehydrogenase family) [Sediminitomix flava]
MQKIAVITGANRGIGKQICLELAQQGFKVFAGMRKLENSPQEFNDLDITPSLLDVTDVASVDAFATELGKQASHIDVLINNAGVMGTKALADFDLEEIRWVMETNFFGPIQMTKAMIPFLKKSSDARIINISSEMGAFGSLPIGGYGAYRMSKTSLNSFTAILSSELEKHNIKVNSMCPTWVKTGMGGDAAPGSVEEGADTAIWLATASAIPNGKFLQKRSEINW